MSHKFKLGQHVRQSRSGFGSVKGDPSGQLCEIVRLMPVDRAGEPSELTLAG